MTALFTNNFPFVVGKLKVDATVIVEFDDDVILDTVDVTIVEDGMYKSL
jgi:hypothetical protein